MLHVHENNIIYFIIIIENLQLLHTFISSNSLFQILLYEEYLLIVDITN